MPLDRDKHKLWLINQIAVRLGLVSQEDADMCTLNGKSLQYRIDEYLQKRDNPKEHASAREVLKRAMWENTN